MVYSSRKIIDTGKNFEIYNVEHFVIVQNFCHLRHYLKKLCNNLKIVIYNSNLLAFMTTDKFTRKQVQKAFDFVRPLPVPELLVKSDGIYQAALWLRNPVPSRRLHN